MKVKWFWFVIVAMLLTAVASAADCPNGQCQRPATVRPAGECSGYTAAQIGRSMGQIRRESGRRMLRDARARRVPIRARLGIFPVME